MKLLIGLIITALMAAGLAGCATPYPMGNLLTNVTLPVSATDEGPGAKVGEASCASYFAMVSTGDCGLEAAKQNGGISKISHVDWHAHNILGVIGHYKVIVHGD